MPERSAAFDVGLAAAVQPAPGALITQFLANQVQNCSLICPFVAQGAVQIPAAVLSVPGTFLTQLQAGQPLVQALGLSGATVSGAANDVWTGLISTDLGQVVPRTEFGTEVIAVGLVQIGEAALTQPGSLPGVLGQARTDLFAALTNPPGPERFPAVHTPLEATAVRVTAVFWAVAFHATEQLTLIVTRVPNAFLTTLGTTGNVGKAVQAAGQAVSTTVSESIAPIRDALTKPIPITPAVVADPAPKSAVKPVKEPAAQPNTTLKPKQQTSRISPPTLPAVPSAPVPSASPSPKPPNLVSGLGGTIKKVLGDIGVKKPSTPDKPVKAGRH